MINEELQDSREDVVEGLQQYTDLYDFAPVGYFNLKRDGTICRANLTGASMLGVDRSKLMNSRFGFFVSEETRPAFNELLQKVFESKIKKSCEVSLLKEGNELLYVHIDATAGIDGQECKMTMVDITERKRAELEIVMLAHSLRSVNECVSITDMEDKIMFVNESFLKTYGYDENELVEKRMSIVLSLNNPMELVAEILPATLRGGWIGELWNKRKDGSEFQIHLSTNTVRNKDGKTLGLIGVAKDITELKKDEEEIKESKRQLEQLYSHLTDVRENERAGISREIHDELGQSLTALKMDLNWTKENVANKMLFDKKLNGMINIVTETIRKVQKISSDLRPGMLDDLGLIPAIEWYCQEFEERTGLQCHLVLKEIPLLNSKNILTLFRILQEGLTNIIRHANAKSVEVKLYYSPGKIFLEINDDGIGISKEKINSKDSIGLIGMKERLRQFNGTLEIFSSKNNGTSLLISIPIVN
jgi:two-component system sensor histidine kinase UhpB